MDRAYDQSHKPVREQTEAVGHSVRALYLYIAMTDVGRLTDDRALLDTCRALFADIVRSKLYITGGAGSGWYGERFTVPYNLPNAERTRRRVRRSRSRFSGERLSKAGNSAQYHATLERALYNNILAGESADGKGFYYVNPLERTGITPPMRVPFPECLFKPLLERVEVFDCSCCPPNLVRFFAQVGDLHTAKRTAFCTSISICLPRYPPAGIDLSVKTGLPYAGNVSIRANGKGRLALRIPVWQTVALVQGERGVCRTGDQG